MDKNIIIYQCNNIGISGTTPVFIKNCDDRKFEARCGFSLFGTTNMTENEFLQCDYNPFHEDFNDNYASGFGESEESAIADLKVKMNETAESLWL